MSSTSNETITENSIPYSRTIIFRIFIILLIPSLVCSFLIFYYVIRLPQLRKQTSNHIIFVLLMVLFIQALIDLPFRLYYLNNNTVLLHTPAFCLFWNWIDFFLDTVGLYLMALASIERYLFVFHNPFLSPHRLVLSKLPAALCIIYPLVFYTFIIYGSWWCTNYYDYSAMICGPACYVLSSAGLSIFNVLNHVALPVFIIFSANLILIIRVWKQKKRMNQRNLWRKNVRMSAQLLSISFIHLITWVPLCILVFLINYGPSEIQAVAAWIVFEYVRHFTSFTNLLCPFVALAGLSLVRNNIKQDLTRILYRQNPILINRIMPIDGNIAMHQIKTGPRSTN